MHDEPMRLEDAAEALKGIGLNIGVDESGRPTINWMGIAVRMADQQGGAGIVVAEFGDGTMRIVQPSGEPPVVEVCVGRNAALEKTWMRAVVTPDWRGDGQTVLFGWPQIANALGVSVNTAKRFAMLANHRLPVRFQWRSKQYQPTIPMLLLQAWLRDSSFSGVETSNDLMKLVHPRKKLRRPKQQAQ
jgi:hypothetical protein